MTTEISFVLDDETMELVHRNALHLNYSHFMDYLNDAICRALASDALSRGDDYAQRLYADKCDDEENNS